MNGQNLVLFVSGKASSGKDTFVKLLRLYIYKYLNESYFNFQESIEFVKTGIHPKINEFELGNQVVYTFPFADEVKKELCRKNPEVSLNRLLTDVEYKEQYRKELVDIGDGYRKNNKNIWIDYHKPTLVEFLEKNDRKIAVVTDLRYQNEFEYFLELAQSKSQNVFLSIRIEAALPVRLSRMSKAGMLNYLNRARYNASEVELDCVPGFDMYVINNDEALLGNCMDKEVKMCFELWRKIFK